MSTMSIGMIIPVLILVLFFQRLIVSGLTKGAIKKPGRMDRSTRPEFAQDRKKMIVLASF